MGVTRSSRHCGFCASGLGRWRDICPVGVDRVWEAVGEGGTDWKAWIGSASKNSWANMKGVRFGSGLSGQLSVLAGGSMMLTIGDEADVFAPCDR